MEKKSFRINNKTVDLSEPYKATVTEIVGREEEIQRILAAWIAGENRLPLSPLLVGGAGLGKNRTVYECACRCAKELYIFQGHEDVSA